MRAAGLVNFLLTGICLTPEYGILRPNNTLKKEVELLTDESNLQDVCLLPDKNILAGKKLTIATWQDWPSSGARIDEKGNRVGTGYAFEFVEVLQEKFGFSYEVILPEENIIGDSTRGIFGLLSNKRADMAAAFLPISPSTMKLATPSVSLGDTEFVVLMKRPKASATGSGLLAPFAYQVWILILVSLIAVGPIMCGIIMFRGRLLRRKKPLLVPGDPGEPEVEEYPLSSCVWFVYGALMKQGSTLSPRADSTRMLFATWWLFILVLTAYYTANLTAFLTLSKFTLPIDSPADIPRTRYRWFAERGSILENAIVNDSGVSALDDMPARFEPLSPSYEVWEDRVVKLVTKDGLLYLEERRKVEYLIFRQYLNRTATQIVESDRCQLAMTPKSFMAKALGFFYPKNSALKKLFDKTLLNLIESGIVKHRQRAILPLNQICPLNLRNKERRLANRDLLTTYKVIGSGFAAGFVAFVLELFLQRWQRQRARQRAESAQRKLLGSPVEPPYSRKRVRLKVPVGTPSLGLGSGAGPGLAPHPQRQRGYPGDTSQVMVLPPGMGKMGSIKAHLFGPGQSPDFIFR